MLLKSVEASISSYRKHLNEKLLNLDMWPFYDLREDPYLSLHPLRFKTRNEGHNPDYMEAVNKKIAEHRKESKAITDNLFADIGLDLRLPARYTYNFIKPNGDTLLIYGTDREIKETIEKA